MLKQLTLDLATHVFLGLDLGPRADALTTAFVDTVRAGTGLVRGDVPLTKWHRGLEGRGFLEAFFREELAGQAGRAGRRPVRRRCASWRTTRATASPTTTSSTT